MMEGRRTAAIGVLLVLAAALADIAAGEDVVLIPLLVVGPLVAAVRAPVRQVAAVSLLALVVAVPLGAANGISGGPSTSATSSRSGWSASSRSSWPGAGTR